MGLVCGALGNDKLFARRHVDCAVAKIDSQIALQHDERLVGVLVIVPDEGALELHDLELVIVHFGDDLRLPLLVEKSQLLAEVDRLVAHLAAPTMDGASISFPMAAVQQVLRRPRKERGKYLSIL